jgi:hypothetical protein
MNLSRRNETPTAAPKKAAVPIKLPGCNREQPERP